MPDSSLRGDVVEEEEERGGGEDGQHGLGVAVHHPDSVSRVVFAAVASYFEICHFYGSLFEIYKFMVHRKCQQDTIFQV